MATKMVCDVQDTKWVCDKCGFGWVASSVLECKMCSYEAELKLARREHYEEGIAKGNKIIELASALKTSEEIRYAEEKVLLEEIRINHQLHATIARLKVDVDVAESLSRHSPSPCGHSSQYAYSKDGGKHIVCLLCSYEHKEKLASAAREVVRISDREHDAWQLLKKRLAET